MATILVIEDEFPIRELICALLKIEDYDVIEAENGRQGLARAKEALPDLIICDVMMPDLDGYQVLTELQRQADTVTIPFIFLTAKGTTQDIRQGMKLGADDYLIKPFNRDDLLDAVATRLRKRQTASAVWQKARAETPQDLEILLGRSPATQPQGRASELLSEADQHLLADLETALAENQLTLYYQPQFNLQTLELTGCEALLRWFHPQRGAVSPGLFIPLAEKSDLILSLGEWVVEQALTQWRRWRDSGLGEVRIAVNLSARQLRQPQFIPWLLRALEAEAIPPQAVEVELTETTLVENVSQSSEQLQALKRRGIWIAIDDFGTGYSSLSYLQQFSFDVLKIDRCFVQNVAQNNTNMILTQAMIDMAHHLNIRVLAEGVETLEEFQFLKQGGCDELQGYLFSPALAPEVFTEKLQNGFSLPQGIV
jgi:EAL domain-containing protein (putative c-di-GMP-specific phosphodiesterase class I)/DNA-binding NarL/FixJ family response regulator